MEKERPPLSFWLKDKTVTGLLAAEHGGKKLVAYNRRYYVVIEKTPEKRHFTESTLPSVWRKVISGELPPSPAQPSKPALKESPVAAKHGAVPGKPEESPAAGEPPARPRKESKKKVEPEPARQPEAPPGGAKQKRSRAKAAEQQTVPFNCPYCSAEDSCGVDLAGAPFFQKCSKCGKDFGVRIRSRIVFEAEVAGFK